MIPVPGEGQIPPPSGVVLVGEAPGYMEMQRHRPFVGKSGKELDGHLERAGLLRETVYLTNLVKEQPPTDAKGKQLGPSKELIAQYEPVLLEELAACRPLWIGAVGRFAARWLCGDLDMESHHAMAFPLRREVREQLRYNDIIASRTRRAMLGERLIVTYTDGGWPFDPIADDSWIDRVRVVPLYHPAAGLHNPEIQPLVWYDVRTFAAYVHGRLHPTTPVDPHPHPRYVDGLDGWPQRVGLVAVDTEGDRPRPWSVQIAHRPGQANVVRYASFPALGDSVREIFRNASKLIFQYSLHDAEILETMGIDIDWERVEDIYLMADVLRLVPRGLKAGCRRDCAMEMRGYREVVGPAEKRLAMEYVKAAIDARRCWKCDGVGYWENPEKMARAVLSGMTGHPVTAKRLKSKAVEKCPDCVDGGLWEPRTQEVMLDPESGIYKVRSGWEVQRYLRTLQKDLEAGKYDNPAADEEDASADDETAGSESPRSRFGNWPEEVQNQIASALQEPMPEPTLNHVPLKEAIDYAGRDADGTLRRYPILLKQIEELGLEEAYRLDLDVMPVAAAIQKNGMRINVAYFAELANELEDRKASVADELAEHIGRRLNPGSPDQVAALLYTKMRLLYDDDDDRVFRMSFELEPEKWTPTRKRGATDEKTLEGIKLKYASDAGLVRAVDLILRWKMIDKCEQFARKLPRFVDARGRIHPRVKIGPATFRWAMADPNLQQIPIREKHGEDLGRRIRLGFQTEDGRILVSRDYDQVEVRVVAWYAQDETLLRMFREAPSCPVAFDPAHPLHYKGKCRCHDPHFLTASLVFKIPLAAVTKAQRDSAKNIKFGVIYGITEQGLKAQMDLRGVNWSLEECRGMIDRYKYEAYPGIGRFINDAYAEARQNNMVRSLMGHIRYCPAVHSPIAAIKEEALRQAANFKIQCTAGELHKIAKRNLYRDCRERFDELQSLIVLSVHDELIAETPDEPDVREEIDALMGAYMTNPYPLEGIEITSGSKWDRSWGNLK